MPAHGSTNLHELGLPGAYLYGDAPGATYSELHSFYLLVDRPSVYGLPDIPSTHGCR